MNILIIENEIYLAQSIASKLSDLGHHCDISNSPKDAIKEAYYDIVLLSTNITGDDIYSIINAYKTAVIILMVSYVSNDTVLKPLAHGAKDYILKPFMIEELIRKIDHFQLHEKLKRELQTYERYVTHHLSTIALKEDLEKIELPVMVCTGYQKYADAFAFGYSQHRNQPLQFVSLSSPKALHDIAIMPNHGILYITDFHQMKKSDYKSFFDLVTGRDYILSGHECVDVPALKTVEIKTENQLINQGEILSIEEYVKHIILHSQNRFPDTELSKKLGISRKSLWEKRRKYGIIKQK
jgi:CheY-like chemotaxis protein